MRDELFELPRGSTDYATDNIVVQKYRYNEFMGPFEMSSKICSFMPLSSDKKKKKINNIQLIIWEPHPPPREPIQSWNSPFDPVSRNALKGTCHLHIKALLFVCVRGSFSRLFPGSYLIDTAAGCHRADVASVSQVELSFDLYWNCQRWGRRQPGPSLLY